MSFDWSLNSSIEVNQGPILDFGYCFLDKYFGPVRNPIFSKIGFLKKNN